jgi:CRISPR/Cas system-associated exonuclease Cas4 (RecB family)
MLTKTDFLEYLDCPAHLWARKNDLIEVEPSLFDQHLMQQGRVIEELAQTYLRDQYIKGKGEVSIQKTFQDGSFLVRVDAALEDPAGNWIDIYEIKSSTSIKKEHYYDLTFQKLVVEKNQPVRDVYLVFVNGNYTQDEELEPEGFFQIENLSEQVQELQKEVALEREIALEVIQQDSPEGITTCHHPGSCPCPSLCHGKLPEYSIYNLPRLGEKRAIDLGSQGIKSIHEVPADYDLTEKQGLHLLAVKSGGPVIDKAAIRSELEALEYPLYFLDYETYSPGLPLYPGYKPYQHIVFQYSLHVMGQAGELDHHELLVTEEGDPGLALVPHLLERIGKSGSVLVWNKSFEMGKNRAMAERYPAYSEGLININERVYDLMQIFSKAYYVEAGFHGSASLKAVLPVFIPEFKYAYEDLAISGGDQAMLVWGEIQAGRVLKKQIPGIRKDLLAYCKLDTLAMVRIWEKLKEVGLG